MDINILIGKTFSSIEQETGSENDIEALIFNCKDGTRYTLYHEQDCCESVYIESITGDLSDLIGSPVTLAEEINNADMPTAEDKYNEGSFTWTFYKFATLKGYVDIRWYGTSNGCYSEEVSFKELK